MSETRSAANDSDITRLMDDLLTWRRDVRHFLRRPIAELEMERLFELAQCAPSVGNAQPWRFIRVRDKGLRAALADHVDEAARNAGLCYEGERATRYASLKLHGLREAPEILAVYSDEAPSAGQGLGRATMPETLRYSTVLAIHTLWLAAQSRGIGLGWISIVEPRRISAMLAAPPQWHFVALLCLGYADAPSSLPELERRGWQARLDWRDTISER